MGIAEVMAIIEKDMQLAENFAAGELFLSEISYDESSNNSAHKILKEWVEIRENPDLYEFLSLCEQVRLQLVREDISEGDAINMIKDLGCFHKGFPTEVEILDYLYSEELEI